jgi:hypothetical protein
MPSEDRALHGVGPRIGVALARQAWTPVCRGDRQEILAYDLLRRSVVARRRVLVLDA